MSETADIIREGATAMARQGAILAGLTREGADALAAMKPGHRYRLDRFAHPEGAQRLIERGLAHDISSDYAGAIRGATLSTAGQILRGAIHGVDAD